MWGVTAIRTPKQLSEMLGMNCGPVGNTVNIHGQSSDQAVADVRSTSSPAFYVF